MAIDLPGPVRVRFAPSPTGYLHVGGARTAIFNDLLRQSLGGAFILRIEDTDRERSDEAMTRQIRDALEWIGVDWDEGPFLQSERIDRHRERAAELLASGAAYRDYATPDEIEAQRRRAHAEGVSLRSLGPAVGAAEAARREAAGDPSVVRFRSPDEPVQFVDLVKGEVAFTPEVLEDFVILRSDGTPTYHLSVVCDDIDMGVTVVLRGDDHLDNTAKHVPLFAALGASVPRFAHVPLILGSDRKRLSKRTGATSVEEFREQGILPEALYNYVALLGWSPGDDREVMTRSELVEAFTVDRLSVSASVFDVDKLAWMNAQYMSGLPLATVLAHLGPFLDAAGLAEQAGSERLASAVELHRGRAKNLRELAEAVRIYFLDQITYDEALSRKYLGKDPELVAHLATLAERYAEAEPYDIDTLDQILRGLADEVDVKAGALIHPTRMALSGSKAGPPLFDLVAAMGRDATSRHLATYRAYLESLPRLEDDAEP